MSVALALLLVIAQRSEEPAAVVALAFACLFACRSATEEPAAVVALAFASRAEGPLQTAWVASPCPGQPEDPKAEEGAERVRFA